jgi:protein-tyrosine phosphatase
MVTEVVTVDPGGGSAEAVGKALDVLEQGGLVAFPTETVYGLGGRTDRAKALDQLRSVKGRSSDKALTVHLGTSEEAGRFVPNMGGRAHRLIKRGWPGPLTLVLPVEDPSRAEIAGQLNGPALSAIYYQKTVGLRCPDEPTATALLRGSQAPVVATSANQTGHPPPFTAAEVLRELQGRIDLILDGGRTRYAKASTIVRVNGASLEVLREGILDSRIVADMAMLRILFVCSGNTCRSPMAAALARKLLAERLGCRPQDLVEHGVCVESAGTSGGIGSASDHAVAVMARRGMDLSDHVSSALRTESIRQADFVFVMTRSHFRRVLELEPTPPGRVDLLVHGEDIADPVGGTIDDYEACAETIQRGLEARLKEVAL